MTEEITYPNDPALLEKEYAESIAKTGETTEVVSTPLGHWMPPVIVPVVSTPIVVIDPPVITEVTTVPVPPPLTEEQLNPVVDYVGYSKTDEDRRIIVKGSIHRNQLAQYASFYEIREVSSVKSLNLTDNSAWDEQTGTIIEIDKSVLSLDYVKYHATCAIDAKAETLRLNMITPGAGQALVYQGKKEEAARFLSMFPASDDVKDESLENWPLLSAEVPVTAPTMWLVAQTVCYLSKEWTLASSLIETVRLQAKVAVSNATTPADVATAYNVIVWPVM